MLSPARGDRRCPPVVDGVDDLRGIDAAEIDRRDAEVDVAELSLDHLQRDTFAGPSRQRGRGAAGGERSGAAPLPSLRSGAGGCARLRASRASPRLAIDDAEQRSDRHLEPAREPRLELIEAPGVHADLAPLAQPCPGEPESTRGPNRGLVRSGPSPRRSEVPLARGPRSARAASTRGLSRPPGA